jgi:hypothetical protein
MPTRGGDIAKTAVHELESLRNWKRVPRPGSYYPSAFSLDGRQICRMPTIRYIMLISAAIAISAIGLAVLLEGHGYLVQALPRFVKSNDETVRDGMKVTVQYQITPQDHSTTTYSDTQQFIQGQHILPPGLEQQIAGMHQGESTTFPLSAEEGFGPHDATKIRIIPTGDLPLDAQEGDSACSGDGSRYRRTYRAGTELRGLDARTIL